MTAYEHRYSELVRRILSYGEYREGRNGATRSVFGEKLVVQCDLSSQIPLLNGRRLFPKGVLGEFAAFIRGPKHVQDFVDQGCNYWHQWANEDGSIDLDYGNQWFDFNGVNQVEALIKSLKEQPHGRRHIINGWRPDRLDKVSLPSCHFLYQWYVDNSNRLHMIWYQRSVDVMVGLPSDVILAAIFNMCMAKETGLIPGDLIFMLGDCHIYSNHTDGAYEYLAQAAHASPHYPCYEWTGPTEGLLTTNKFTGSMLNILDYKPRPSIHFEVSK